MDIKETKYIRRVCRCDGYYVTSKIVVDTGTCEKLHIQAEGDCLTVNHRPDVLIDMILACVRPS